MAPVRRGKFVAIAEDSGSSSDEDETSNAQVPAKRVKPNPGASSSDDSSESESGSSSSDGRIARKQPAAQATHPASAAAEESSDESNDSSDEDDGVIGRLKEFLTSSERVMTLKGTSTLDRKLAHTWVETHRDAAVRSWGHVAKLVGAERVMTITKSDEYVATAASATKAAAKSTDGAKGDSDDSSDSDESSDSDDHSDSDVVSVVKSVPLAADSIGTSSDNSGDSSSDDDADDDSSDDDAKSSGDDDSVLSKLERFAKSSERVLTIAGTTGPDRAAVHKWVETHADPAVREWSHVSKTVGPDRLMTVTKTGTSLSGASVPAVKPKSQPAPAAAAAAKPKSADDDDTSAGSVGDSTDAETSDDSDDSSSSTDGPTLENTLNTGSPGGDLTELLKVAEAAKMQAFASNKFDALPGLQAEIDRINGLLAQTNLEQLKEKLAAAEAAKVAAFSANNFAVLPDLQKEVDRLTALLKSNSTRTASESHPKTSADNTGSESDSVASASDKSSTDDSGSESDDEIEDAGVLGRLKRFYRSPEQVLILEHIAAPDRSAVHEWVEGHDDPIVHSWGHTSKTVGTSRVMTVTKSGALGTSDDGQKKRPVSESAASDRPSKKSRSSASAGGDGETARRFEDGKHILFIGQLPYDATASQIQGHFETAAAVEIMGGNLTILGVRLLTDPTTGKSRGMAFVDCDGDEDLERGVHMHQSKLLGRRINVEKSASGGGKTDRRKRFIQKSKEEYEEIRRSRVAEALESRLRRSDHELGVDDVDEEIRGFLLSVPVHVAVEALDEFHTAVVKTPPTSRRAYLMGVLKRLHDETDSTMPLNKRRGHDRKKGGVGSRGGGRGGGRGAGRGRGASSFASGGIGGAFGASARGGRGGGGRGAGTRGSKW